MAFWGWSFSDQQVLGCFQIYLRVLCAPAGTAPGCANSDIQGEGAVTALQRSLLGIFKILLLQLGTGDVLEFLGQCTHLQLPQTIYTWHQIPKVIGYLTALCRCSAHGALLPVSRKSRLSSFQSPMLQILCLTFTNQI